jgi:acyl carrier protein
MGGEVLRSTTGEVGEMTAQAQVSGEMTARAQVRKFIIENFYVADPAALGDDTSLIGGGWVDSTGMLEVISFLEVEFGIRVADLEMVPENLDSIERIARFVARKGG